MATMASSTPTATRLYVANVALLTTHQADAVAWREWDVFGVPGGLPGFLAFNAVAVAVLATGLVRLAEGARSARRAALLCAGLGLFTVALHAVFLGIEPEAFRAPASLGVLLCVLVISVVQLRHLPESPESDVR